MVTKVISSDIKSVDYIIHISDVHIRTYQRHKEYSEVFNRLYKEIENIVNYHDNVIIVLSGDLVHTKTDISNELVDFVGKFLKKLMSYCHVFIFLGQHDINLNNKSRLDSITPIINNINSKRIHFFKDTGTYIFGDVVFNLKSVLDEETIGFPTINTEEYKKYKKIALYHGIVSSAITDIGYRFVDDDYLNISDFKDYDITLLGDIHKFQYLNSQKTIAYPSSLIQQKHDELLTDHGFLFWDLNNKTSKYIPIKNDYGFLTLHIEDNKLLTKIDSVPKNLKIRVKSKNTKKSEVLNLIKNFQKDFQNVKIEELVSIDTNLLTTGKQDINYKISDIRQVENQNKLITTILEDDGIDKDKIAKIININKEFNKKLKLDDRISNVIWIPKSFEFSNMFNFGEDNDIVFNGMTGLYGLFNKNKTGKSSIIDAILYCIYDKCTRTSLSSEVLNKKKDNFYCKFCFILNDKEYIIERIAKKDKKGHVKVDVNFYSIQENGEKEYLNGKLRSETNTNIKKYLGNYDDFILTTISAQDNNLGFINIGQKDKKELFTRFLDITFFGDLYNFANDEIKKYKVLIKDIKDKNYDTKYYVVEQEIKDENNKLLNVTEQYNNLIKDINLYKIKISKLESKLIDDENLDLDIDNSIGKKIVCEKLIQEKLSSKKELEEKNTEQNSLLDAVKIKLEAYDENQLNDDKIKFDSLNDQLNNLNIKQVNITNNIKSIKDKSDKLLKLEYDEDCTYCMNNIFVKDAIEAEKQLLDYEKDNIENNKLIEVIKKEKLLVSDVQEKLKSLSSLKTDSSKLKDNIIKIAKDTNDVTDKINESYTELNIIQNNIEKYYEIKENIVSNNKINLQINAINKDLTASNITFKTVEQELINIKSNIKILKNKEQDIKNKIAELRNIEEKYKDYYIYSKLVDRDGIPNMIIKEILPYVETEVNNILTQIVDFTIKFDSDTKNINVYIVDNEGEYWALNLGSGMEKFISSLAIRDAFMKISNLNKSTFLIIDEGFGKLDKDHFNSLDLLFNYLKSQYSFIIVVSHIMELRDLVDNIITIKTVDNFGQLTFK